MRLSINCKQVRSGLFTLILATAGSVGALAQGQPGGAARGYPNRPIRLIAPFPAGGGYDFLARLIGQKMAEAWGQQVVVENRAGANGNIGVEAAAKSPPDGYTLVMSGNGPHALNVGLYPKLPYDPVKDFEPITLVASQPNLLVIHPSVPARSLAEFIEYAKSRPGKLSYASNGNGSGQQLAAEQLKQMAGIEMVHVPYKGAAPAMAAILTGEVSAEFNIILLPLQHVQAGKLNALAVASAKRSPLAPNIPTMTELGFPIDIDTWYGMLAPGGTPREIIARLNGEIVRILSLPDIRERTRSQGIEVIGSTPEEFALHIKTEIAKWSKVIKDAHITID